MEGEKSGFGPLPPSLSFFHLRENQECCLRDREGTRKKRREAPFFASPSDPPSEFDVGKEVSGGVGLTPRPIGIAAGKEEGGRI